MVTDKILPLLESLLLRIEESGQLAPLGASALRFMSQLEDSTKTLGGLFGCANFAELVAVATSGQQLQSVVTGPAGARWGIQWQFAALESNEQGSAKTLLATGINWLPTSDLVTALTRENLLYKEMILNLIPSFIAEKLLQQKVVQPKAYRDCSVMFADVVSFSRIAFHLDPVSLLKRLDQYFSAMDRAARPFLMEKIKTIGDAYMAVSGIPHRRPSHAVDAALAVLHMIAAISKLQLTPQLNGTLDLANWQFRFGMHSGPCIAGVLGSSRYLFDLWGDTVNIASRMEGVSQANLLTVSEATQRHLAPYFVVTYAGEKSVKNIGDMKIYRVERLLPEYAEDAEGITPNQAFFRRYISEFYDGPGRPQSSALPDSFFASATAIAKNAASHPRS